MLAKERQNQIIQWLRVTGAVTTAELVSRLRVSVETVRRDLLELEQRGMLSRVHGGAVAKGSFKAFGDLQQRNQAYSREKQALSRAAAQLVCEGDVIAIDAGSTAIAFAGALKERLEKLTVITHSWDVFDLLRDHAQFQVISSGGAYLRKERAFYGPIAEDGYGKLCAGKAFLFPSAVSLRSGICDFLGELYPLQRKLLQTAGQVFVLADSSKFEQQAMFKLDDMRKEYTYVTDNALPDQLRKLYQSNGYQMIIGE